MRRALLWVVLAIGTVLALSSCREGLSEVVQVDTGSSHSCALHADGTVSCWGPVAQDASAMATEAGTARTRAEP
jgi:alpha-tubulin suppressor-like RCC1 family protein